jgi:hypothetical protein
MHGALPPLLQAGDAGGGSVHTGNGGPLTTISSSGSFFRGFTGRASINDKGLVAFHGFPDEPFASGIFTGSGGPITPVAVVSPNGGFFHSVTDRPAINDAGTVGFVASYSGGGLGVFTRQGSGPVISVADNAGAFASFGFASLNNTGTVAFTADLDDGSSGIYTGNTGQPVTLIVGSDGPLSSFSTPSISDKGNIAFTALADTGGGGVYVRDGNGLITPVADSSGAFSSFGAVAINDGGMVLFYASLDAGGFGLFTGADPLNDRIIGSGDAFFGSTVTQLEFFNQGLNRQGQVGFRYTLANGVEGVAIATPVPEPSSVVSRKAHGGAGSFDIDLPLTGAPGIECRDGGANNDHQIVLTFPFPVAFASAAVTSGTGNVASTTGNGTAQVAVNLTGVTNAHTITLTLFSVSNGTNSNNVTVPMSILRGDTSGNRSVTSTDIGQVKSQSGQAVAAD